MIRDIVSNITGDIVRGIMPPPFSPLDVPSTGLWVDYSDTDTITDTANETDNVADKSGNIVGGLSQTGTKRPITNVETINGLNVLDFTGDSLNSTDSKLLDIVNGTNTEYTYFMVLKPDVFSTFGIPLSWSSNAHNNDFFVNSQVGGGGWRWQNETTFNVGGTNTNYNFSTSVLTSLANVLCIRNNGAKVRGYRDGVQEFDTILSNAVLTSNIFSVGSFFRPAEESFFDGKIGEIIIYKRGLTDSEINQVNSYLISKWQPTNINNPETTDLTTQMAAFQSGKVKSDLVKVDVSEKAEEFIDYNSGLSNTAIQLVGVNQPEYIDSSINGKPALRFEGASSENYLSIDGTVGNAAFQAPHTIFIVAKSTTNSRGLLTKGLSRNSFNNKDWDLFGDGVDIAYSNTSNVAELVRPESTFPTLNTPVIIAVQWDGTTDANGAKLYIDGVLTNEATATGIGFGTNHTVNIGGKGINSFDGDIGEVVMYDAILSATERNNVLNYLSAKWKVPLKL